MLRTAGPVTAIGVAFAAQEVPQVPRHAGDQRLDAILTETGPVPLDSANQQDRAP